MASHPRTGRRPATFAPSRLNDDAEAVMLQGKISTMPGTYALTMGPRAHDSEQFRAAWPGGGRSMHAGQSCVASKLMISAHTRASDGSGRINVELPGSAAPFRGLGDGLVHHIDAANDLNRGPWRGDLEGRKMAKARIAETDPNRWNLISGAVVPVEKCPRGGVSSRVGNSYTGKRVR